MSRFSAGLRLGVFKHVPVAALVDLVVAFATEFRGELSDIVLGDAEAIILHRFANGAELRRQHSAVMFVDPAGRTCWTCSPSRVSFSANGFSFHVYSHRDNDQITRLCGVGSPLGGSWRSLLLLFDSSAKLLGCRNVTFWRVSDICLLASGDLVIAFKHRYPAVFELQDWHTTEPPRGLANYVHLASSVCQLPNGNILLAQKLDAKIHVLDQHFAVLHVLQLPSRARSLQALLDGQVVLCMDHVQLVRNADWKITAIETRTHWCVANTRDTKGDALVLRIVCKSKKFAHHAWMRGQSVLVTTDGKPAQVRSVWM